MFKELRSMWFTAHITCDIYLPLTNYISRTMLLQELTLVIICLICTTLSTEDENDYDETFKLDHLPLGQEALVHAGKILDQLREKHGYRFTGNDPTEFLEDFFRFIAKDEYFWTVLRGMDEKRVRAATRTFKERYLKKKAELAQS